MGGRLAIALLAVAFALGAGYFIYSKVFATEAAAPVEPNASPPIAPIIADAAEPLRAISVLRVAGLVERQRSDGQWTVVAAGDSLQPDDILRTGSDGSIDFDLAGKSIGLDRDTTLSIAQLADIDTIRVDQGRVSASVAGQDKPLRVEVKGSDAVAETSEGDFDVLASDGDMTVASRRGAVELKAAGKTVIVSTGEQSTARKGGEPTAAAPIPKSLFLKVRAASRTREKSHTLRGKTSPGAIISVNGIVVRVGESGEFTQVVSLREGRNEVEIVGRDVSGRSERKTAKITVDTRAPEVGGKMSWEK